MIFKFSDKHMYTVAWVMVIQAWAEVNSFVNYEYCCSTKSCRSKVWNINHLIVCMNLGQYLLCVFLKAKVNIVDWAPKWSNIRWKQHVRGAEFKSVLTMILNHKYLKLGSDISSFIWIFICARQIRFFPHGFGNTGLPRQILGYWEQG